MDSGIGKALSGTAQASPSCAKKLKLSAGVAARAHVAFKAFDELSNGTDCVIKAMVCRAWSAKNPQGRYIGTEYILGDDKGAAMHCIARNSIAHCVVPKLEVGNIYSISKFSLGQNKDFFRVRRNDQFLIHLEGNTVIHRLDCSATGYVRHPFDLVPIEEITFNNNKYLIDVVGRVVSLGVIKPTRNGSQCLDFHLLNERGNTVKVTLWGDLCDEIKSRCDNCTTHYVVLLPAMNIREFRGAVQLSSTSGTLIYDSLEIPEISSLQLIMGEKPIPSPDNSGTLLQLLMLGREQKGKSDVPSVTLICRVKVFAVRPRNSWHYYSCGLGGCRKGLTPRANHFWCESCEKKIDFPLLKFRLHLDIADSTSTIVATVFDELAELLVKKPAQTVMESLGDGAEENNLPDDISQLVGTEHTFKLKSHTYYNHGYYESFTVSRVVEYSQPQKGLGAGAEKEDSNVVPSTTAQSFAVLDATTTELAEAPVVVGTTPREVPTEHGEMGDMINLSPQELPSPEDYANHT